MRTPVNKKSKVWHYLGNISLVIVGLLLLIFTWLNINRNSTVGIYRLIIGTLMAVTGIGNFFYWRAARFVTGLGMFLFGGWFLINIIWDFLMVEAFHVAKPLGGGSSFFEGFSTPGTGGFAGLMAAFFVFAMIALVVKGSDLMVSALKSGLNSQK
jgi:hypothetical protein